MKPLLLMKAIQGFMGGFGGSKATLDSVTISNKVASLASASFKHHMSLASWLHHVHRECLGRLY